MIRARLIERACPLSCDDLYYVIIRDLADFNPDPVNIFQVKFMHNVKIDPSYLDENFYMENPSLVYRCLVTLMLLFTEYR